MVIICTFLTNLVSVTFTVKLTVLEFSQVKPFGTIKLDVVVLDTGTVTGVSNAVFTQETIPTVLSIAMANKLFFIISVCGFKDDIWIYGRIWKLFFLHTYFIFI